MNKTTEHILDTVIMECEDFLRIANDRELTQEELLNMITDLKRVITQEEKALRHEILYK